MTLRTRITTEVNSRYNKGGEEPPDSLLQEQSESLDYLVENMNEEDLAAAHKFCEALSKDEDKLSPEEAYKEACKIMENWKTQRDAAERPSSSDIEINLTGDLPKSVLILGAIFAGTMGILWFLLDYLHLLGPVMK